MNTFPLCRCGKRIDVSVPIVAAGNPPYGSGNVTSTVVASRPARFAVAHVEPVQVAAAAARETTTEPPAAAQLCRTIAEKAAVVVLISEILRNGNLCGIVDIFWFGLVTHFVLKASPSRCDIASPAFPEYFPSLRR